MTEKKFSRISVIGLGYIGLPTAAMFASRKIEVIGVDVNRRAVNIINRGEIHIVEPDLDMVVHAAVHEGYLRATTTPEPAEAYLIAVPTPFKGDNHEPDLSYIAAAARAIAPVLRPGNLVILESTSPVGTTEAMADWLAETRPDLSFPQTHGEASDIRIAHCPERVLPGKVMRELITNDRVIGGMTPRCSAMAARLYHSFVTGDCVVASGPRVAEMAKLTENSFRDVNIAFANELSLICDELGMDVWELIRLANLHPRVNILQPGPGVGGHCIAVDPWFIVSSAPDSAHLIRTARGVNDAKRKWTFGRIKTAMLEAEQRCGRKPVLACLGLAFKPNIDDLRNSPALDIVAELAQEFGKGILTVEPHLAKLPAKLKGVGVRLVAIDQAVTQADVIVGLVAHDAFKTIDVGRLGDKTVIDICAIWV